MKIKLIVAFLCCGALTIAYWDHPLFLAQKQKISKMLEQRPAEFTTTKPTQTHKTTTVYKTQNPDGSWAYTDTIPKDPSQVKAHTYDSDTNVIASVKEKPKPFSKQTKKSKQPTDSDINALTPYTDPGKVLDTINDAKNMQQTLDKRFEDMNKQMEQY